MIMKSLLMTLATVAALFAMVSCSKDYISPEELFGDETKVATIKIHTRSDEFQDTETTFKRVSAYRKSDLEGQSWFSAMSGGKMVYDAFMFSLYFDDIDRMKVGDVLKPGRFWFGFFFSSDSRAYTDSYGGKITLADRGDDYVILRFHKVTVNCSYGRYVIDGYLYCPLYDEFELTDYWTDYME